MGHYFGWVGVSGGCMGHYFGKVGVSGGTWGIILAERA